MLGLRLGPYRVHSELGTGGMGSVYLAEVEEPAAGLDPGTRVAVKAVHPHLLEERGFFKRFLREGDVGRRVVHENVVRTLDVDMAVVEGRQVHYLVMEYVEGKSLRALLTESKRLPEALVRELAEQVAAGLEAIHAAGVVHRDLKPENVMITRDQRVRIMDLGVARLQEATVALTVRGQFAGTLHYAAPEQFRGGEAGPATDQYALGVMLYELLAGANPFSGDTAATVIQAHLGTEPASLAQGPADVTLFLAEVVQVLLEKTPERRFASAAQLRDVLVQGERSAWWAEREAAAKRRQTGLPRLALWREMPMVGRARELDELRAAWTAAQRGEGQVVWIEGEEGLGRTRLVDALFQSLAREEVHALYGAYVPTGGLGGLSDGVVAKFGEAALADGVAPYLSEVPSLVQAFAALVRQVPPPTGAPPLAGESAATVFLHLLRGLARERPVVWAVEDLEHAPADSRRVLLTLARGLARDRALLVLSARPGTVAEEEMGHFARLPHFRRVVLGRLSPREVVEALRGALASRALAERLGGKVAWKSDGIPQAMVDIVRGLEARGLLTRDSGSLTVAGSLGDIEVPSTAQELVRARLREVSEEKRRLLDVGAVAGVSFVPDLVARVLEEKKVRVLQDLAEVARRTGLVRADGHVYRFDGNRVREVLYGDLPLELREEYHAALAEAALDREGLRGRDAADVPEETAAFVAHHHLRGSRAREGVPHLVRALEFLARTRPREERLDEVEQALRLGNALAPADRLDLLRAKALALRTLGRLDAALACVGEAEALAARTGDANRLAHAQITRGAVLLEAHRLDEARAVLTGALERAEATGDDRLVMRARWDLGLTENRRGESAAARDAFVAVRELARKLGDRNAEAASTNNLAIALSDLGQRDEAMELYRQALAVALEVRNRGFEANIRGNLAEGAAEAGRLGEAIAELRDALALQKEFGTRGNEANQVRRLAALLATCGRFEEAAETLDAQAALAGEERTPANEALLREETARVAADGGDLDGAAATLAAALAAPDVPAETRRSLRMTQAWIELRRHRTEDALGALAAAEQEAPAGRGDDPFYSDLVRALAVRDAAKARELLRSPPRRLPTLERFRYLAATWSVSRDPADLAAAWDVLGRLTANAPADDRERMLERVAVFREVRAAAASAGLA